MLEGGVGGGPGYYSGRGAILSNLNSKKLERIYSLIENNRGREAAENFVQMVEEIPVLSATDFLISLSALERNGWKYDIEEVKSDAVVGIVVRKNEDGSYNGLHGGLSVVSALSKGNRDDTLAIRRQFLINHKRKINPRVFYDSSRIPRGYEF